VPSRLDDDRRILAEALGELFADGGMAQV